MDKPLIITSLGPGDLWEVPDEEADEEIQGMLYEIEEAEDLIAKALQALETGDKLAARSLMTEAAGWLREN